MTKFALLWLLITFITGSHVSTVYSAASTEILVEYEDVGVGGAGAELNVSDFTTDSTLVDDNGDGYNGTVTNVPSNRGIFARCFDTIWSWMQEKAVGVMEDNIISGNPDNVRFYLYPSPE